MSPQELDVQTRLAQAADRRERDALLRQDRQIDNHTQNRTDEIDRLNASHPHYETVASARDRGAAQQRGARSLLRAQAQWTFQRLGRMDTRTQAAAPYSKRCPGRCSVTAPSAGGAAMIVSFLDFYDENDRHVLVVVDKIGPGETDEDYTARTVTQGSPQYAQAVEEIIARCPDHAVLFGDREAERTER